MPNERASRLAELVKSAIERGPEECSAFLDEECRTDSAMRAEIESLLAQQEGASRFIETPALHLAAESLVRERAYPGGQTIGDYEILSLIGSGGMGDVYLAQDRQLHRKVALKLIRRGMDSDDIIHHFKREEHLLASLNHPNISQLYGGGVSADEIPFFAMEYVEGQRLDEYCDQRGLGIKERLQLFRKVCAAVTYAHQHLVIHRDLKPANIRVTPDGEPKLLDFGIAKLLDSENAPSSGQTLTLQGVMTPDYASPEQIRGESMATTTDVYSLGVVLYKLLTGLSPYQTKTNRPNEIARAITEQEPTRPSTAITQRNGANPQSAICNPKSLKGDLDNIILMALRKEPQRRYSSVAQFSEDIRRHLDGLPVVARKDTFKYRTAKFIGRNKLGVAAIALVSVTLFGGIIATSMQAHRAEQQRARAEKRFNDVRKLAHSLLFEVFPQVVSVPGSSAASDIIVKRALEYVDSLAQEAASDPALQRELALAYRSLGENADRISGDYAEALKSYRKAVTLDEGLVATGANKAEARDELARDYERVAGCLYWMGDTEAAFVVFNKALAVRESLAASDPRSFDFRYRLAHLLMAIADVCNANGDVKEALRDYRRAMALMETLKEGQPPEQDYKLKRAIIYCHIHTGEALWQSDDLTAAAQEYERALPILTPIYAAGPNDMITRSLVVSVYSGQSDICTKQKDYQNALSKLGECLQMNEPLAKSDVFARNPLAIDYARLAGVLCESGNFAEAMKYSQKAIAIDEQLLAGGIKNNSFTANLAKGYDHLGLAQRKLGDYQAASQSYDKALAFHEQLASDPRNANAQYELALCCHDKGLLHVDLTSSKNLSAEEQSTHWREARFHCERSLKILQVLYEQYPERDLFKSKLEEVDEQLSRCDEALTRL